MATRNSSQAGKDGAPRTGGLNRLHQKAPGKMGPRTEVLPTCLSGVSSILPGTKRPKVRDSVRNRWETRGTARCQLLSEWGAASKGHGGGSEEGTGVRLYFLDAVGGNRSLLVMTYYVIFNLLFAGTYM